MAPIDIPGLSDCSTFPGLAIPQADTRMLKPGQHSDVTPHDVPRVLYHVLYGYGTRNSSQASRLCHTLLINCILINIYGLYSVLTRGWYCMLILDSLCPFDLSVVWMHYFPFTRFSNPFKESFHIIVWYTFMLAGRNIMYLHKFSSQSENFHFQFLLS